MPPATGLVSRKYHRFSNTGNEKLECAALLKYTKRSNSRRQFWSTIGIPKASIRINVKFASLILLFFRIEFITLSYYQQFIIVMQIISFKRKHCLDISTSGFDWPYTNSRVLFILDIVDTTVKCQVRNESGVLIQKTATSLCVNINVSLAVYSSVCFCFL